MHVYEWDIQEKVLLDSVPVELDWRPFTYTIIQPESIPPLLPRELRSAVPTAPGSLTFSLLQQLSYDLPGLLCTGRRGGGLWGRVSGRVRGHRGSGRVRRVRGQEQYL